MLEEKASLLLSSRGWNLNFKEPTSLFFSLSFEQFMFMHVTNDNLQTRHILNLRPSLCLSFFFSLFPSSLRLAWKFIIFHIFFSSSRKPHEKSNSRALARSTRLPRKSFAHSNYLKTHKSHPRFSIRQPWRKAGERNWASRARSTNPVTTLFLKHIKRDGMRNFANFIFFAASAGINK